MQRLLWGAMFVWIGLTEFALSFDENRGNSLPAKLLVSDHTINSITDKNGVVEFLNLPRIEKLPFRICVISKDRVSRFQYSSSTLEFSRSWHFDVDTRTTVQEHTIRVVPEISQK